MRALVTGAGGFVGQYLCRALLREGWDVAASNVGLLPEPGILSQGELSAIHWRNIDLRMGAPERRAIGSLLETSRPDAVFHLVGVSFSPEEGADLSVTMGTNVGGVVNLLDGIREAQGAGVHDPTVLVVGTGEQYGRHDLFSQPLLETAPQRPHTFDAVTKQAQEDFALAAYRIAGIKVIATRTFLHSGRGQSATQMLPSLVAQVRAARETGRPVVLPAPNLTRDFLHVEDVVSAYISLVSRGQPGEVYNVCSGVGVRVEDVALEVLAAAGVRAPLQFDPSAPSGVDVPVLVGSNAKLRATTGWTPLKSRSAIISDLLDAAS